MRFILEGPPRTKKTSNQVVFAGAKRSGKPRILPSKAYLEWHALVLGPATKQKLKYQPRLHESLFVCPVNVSAVFYRKTNTGDLLGYCQALADLLQDASIVENDRLIEGWDGTRMSKDAKYPRIEVEIQELVARAA